MRRRFTLIFAGTAVVAVAGVVSVLSPGCCDRAGPAEVALPFDPDIDIIDEGPAADGPPRTFAGHAAPFLERHCFGCHTGQRPKGGVVLAYPNEAAAVAARISWGKAADAVRSGRMPPADQPRPRWEESEAFLAWADRTAAGSANPGRVTLRRLNRAEYNNTIRDLLGIAFNPADDFPGDDTGDGFDTIGDVLSVSPTLVEKYLTAAEAVIEAAAADPILWQRLRTPPAEDYIPFVLRGPPPQRADAVKGTQIDSDDQAAEIDRTYYALQAFADRAYRRPITHAEMYRLMRFVETSLNNGEAADAGLQLAFKAVLVSPHFLFKVEADPPSAGAADRPLTGFELATRLSYFLWSSLPDEELFRLAANGKLHDPRTLAAQVRRMLKDPRSRALAEQFAGQWLQTRGLSEATRDPSRFPEFDAALVRAMRTETELFFNHVVREDRSVIELLTADYTFVNDRLARHYGIAGVSGNHFRRVSLAGTGRTGVLTHASVLTVTSGPTRTSPVKRGKWVLENVLGNPSPTPPPGVDGLKDAAEGKPATVRAQLERHRSRAECASCHDRLDPLGFGLENFDAVGAWRDRDGDFPIEASGLLPDGRAFAGSREFAAALAARPHEFTRCFTAKLLTYGLGRSLESADRNAVERIVRHAVRNDYRFSSLVIALVRSDPFQLAAGRPGGQPMSLAQMTRRTALRGLGVSITLPFLESLLPKAAGAAADVPLRLAFVYAPNGKHMPDWTPAAEGAKFELPPLLRPLEKVREHVTVLSGLAQRTADAGPDGPGDHARAMATFLTGVRPHKTSGSDVRLGASVDQVAAGVLGKATRFPSLEVGCEGGKPAGTCDNGYSCAYQTNLSWRSATVPMPKEIDPRLLFQRLFGDRLGADADDVRAKRERERRSVLDFVAEDSRELQNRLSGSDRRKLDEYLTAVREVEARIHQAQPTIEIGRDKLVRPTGVPENYREHASLLTELIALAFQADLTRIATFVLGNDGSNRSYREAGVAEGHHDISHHGGDPAKHDKLRTINRFHVARFADLVARLHAIPDGNGRLLDRCLIVYGSGISDGDRHNHDDLPILLAGGGGPGGRHIRNPAGTPLCNLYLSLLDRVGVKADRFGDSTGRLAGLQL